jgi:hypothetical protein
LLLVAWILWVTWYFDEVLQDICDKISGDKKSKRK